VGKLKLVHVNDTTTFWQTVGETGDDFYLFSQSINQSINQSTLFNVGDTKQSGTNKCVALGLLPPVCQHVVVSFTDTNLSLPTRVSQYYFDLWRLLQILQFTVQVLLKSVSSQTGLDYDHFYLVFNWLLNILHSTAIIVPIINIFYNTVSGKQRNYLKSKK